jgi:hypothetical protein
MNDPLTSEQPLPDQIWASTGFVHCSLSIEKFPGLLTLLIASHFVLLHELFSTSADVVLNGPGSRCMDAVWTMKQLISISAFVIPCCLRSALPAYRTSGMR